MWSHAPLDTCEKNSRILGHWLDRIPLIVFTSLIFSASPIPAFDSRRWWVVRISISKSWRDRLDGACE